MLRRTITILALLGVLIAMMALPAVASSGTMSCQTGGIPRTTGYGAGYQYHYVSGYSAWVIDPAPGTTSHYWPYSTGTHSWIVTAPSGGYGACIV